MKILLLDVERSPNVAYVWGLFKENIPLARLISTSDLLCYAAKWYGEDEIFFNSVARTSPKKMVAGLQKLLDEADVVVHYNGTDFDIPVINTEIVKFGLKPPSPYRQVDLLKVVRQQFKFTSNKMDHVAEKLGCGQKHETTFELWTGCMAGDDESWDQMEAYNIEDVMILERMYSKLKPWVKNHPNHGLYQEVGNVCTNCGSEHYTARGFAYTTAGKYQRFQCKDCGSWFRSKHIEERGKESFRT